MEENKTKNKIYKKWWFWVILSIIPIIIIGAVVGSKPLDLIDLPEEEYKEVCQIYKYEDIERNPKEYEKRLAKFTGEITSIIRNGNDLEMIINVTPVLNIYTETYTYTNALYVYYTIKDINLIEGDIVTIYGELRGIESYTNILGIQISKPRIYVKYIDLVK